MLCGFRSPEGYLIFISVIVRKDEAGYFPRLIVMPAPKVCETARRFPNRYRARKFGMDSLAEMATAAGWTAIDTKTVQNRTPGEPENGANGVSDLTSRIISLRPWLMRVCYKFCENVEDAEDLCQEALVKGWQNQGQLREEKALKQFLAKTAKRCWLDELRAARRQRAAPYDAETVERTLADGSPLPGDELELRAAFERFLFGLIPTHQDILRLRVGDELSEKEAAKTLGVELGTVKSRTFEAKRQARLRFQVNR